MYLSINKLRRKKAEKWWMGDKNTKVYYITLFTFYSFTFLLFLFLFKLHVFALVFGENLAVSLTR